LLIDHLLPSCQRIHDFSQLISGDDYGQFLQATRVPYVILQFTMIRDESNPQVL